MKAEIMPDKDQQKPETFGSLPHTRQHLDTSRDLEEKQKDIFRGDPKKFKTPGTTERRKEYHKAPTLGEGKVGDYGASLIGAQFTS